VLRRSSGDVNEHLELLLYQNRLQLATADALYSDGKSYSPAVATAKALKDFLPSVENVLVLGTGLGSLVQVLGAKGYFPHYTLIEKDKTVLGWALELMDSRQAQHTTPVCSDALAYMERNKAQYDLVFIDIFMGMDVPAFVTSGHFLGLCRKALNGNGRLAFNYIVKNPVEWETVKGIFEQVFPGYTVVEKGVNRILLNPAGQTPVP